MMEITEKPKLNYARLFYLLLMVGGVVLYFSWAIYFNAYTDIGLYSIVILMVLFGLFGFVLYGVAPDGGKK